MAKDPNNGNNGVINTGPGTVVADGAVMGNQTGRNTAGANNGIVNTGSGTVTANGTVMGTGTANR
jgi:hypothetical protein